MFASLAFSAGIEVSWIVPWHGRVRHLLSAKPALPRLDAWCWVLFPIAAHEDPRLIPIMRSHCKHRCPPGAVVAEQERLGNSQTLYANVLAALRSLDGLTGSLATRPAVPVPARLRLRFRVVGCRHRTTHAKDVVNAKKLLLKAKQLRNPPAVLEPKSLSQNGYGYFFLATTPRTTYTAPHPRN